MHYHITRYVVGEDYKQVLATTRTAAEARTFASDYARGARRHGFTVFGNKREWNARYGGEIYRYEAPALPVHGIAITPCAEQGHV